MTDREVMQMALEALEGALSDDKPYIKKSVEAIGFLRQALAQPEQDDDAYGYAKRLAECIWEEYYKEESPHWRPCHDVLGVLTQIDNMTCGLEKAQPEQEPVAWLDSDGFPWSKEGVECRSVKDTYTPLYAGSPPIKEQQPVAWRYKIATNCWTYSEEHPNKELAGDAWERWNVTPLYTAPPKREWVGLTDEERVQSFVDAGMELAYMDYDADMKISKVIEAKLREKNT